MQPRPIRKEYDQEAADLMMAQFKAKKEEGDMELYQDPGVYADPNELQQHVRKFCTVLRKDDLQFTTLLGAGEFGEVSLGTLRAKGSGQLTCACKTLRSGSTPAERMDFMTEAAIMGQFSHPNVVSLIGVVLQEGNEVIVIELMQNGELQGYLEKEKPSLELPMLINFCLDVAEGMLYLSGKGFVHRDLAARNILVNGAKVCKVADFGLSQSLDDDSEYFTSEGGKVPIRWTAPEALASRKYTTTSDVWSYGILIWEIMSFGERPYGDMGNLEVFQKVQDGYRLEAPPKCPKQIHDLALQCWDIDRRKRISFETLVEKLKVYKEDAVKNGYLTVFGNEAEPAFRERSNTGTAFGFEEDGQKKPQSTQIQNDAFDYAVAEIDKSNATDTATKPDMYTVDDNDDMNVLAPNETYGADEFVMTANGTYESDKSKEGFSASDTPTPKPRPTVTPDEYGVPQDSGIPEKNTSTNKPPIAVKPDINIPLRQKHNEYGVPQDADVVAESKRKSEYDNEDHGPSVDTDNYAEPDDAQLISKTIDDTPV